MSMVMFMIDKLKKIGLFITLVTVIFLISNYFYGLIFSLLMKVLNTNIINTLSTIMTLFSTTIVTIIFYTIIIKKMKKENINKLENIGLFGLLLLIFLYKDLLYLIPFKLLNIDYNSFNYNIQTLWSLIGSLVIGIILFLVYRKYLIEKFKEFRKNFNECFDIGMKLWFLGLLGMSVTNFLIATFSPIQEANNEVLVQEMLNQAPLLSFISASIFAPFIEEMLFRKSFGDIFKNKKLMVIMSGLVFGLLHVIFSLQTPWDLLYTIPYGLLGSSFAYMMYKKDNIFIPITFHMLHNGILTLLSIL